MTETAAQIQFVADLANQFGQRLKEARKFKELTQVELAEGITSQSGIAQYELAQSHPTLEILMALALRLEMSIDELVGLQRPSIGVGVGRIVNELHQEADALALAMGKPTEMVLFFREAAKIISDLYMENMGLQKWNSRYKNEQTILLDNIQRLKKPKEERDNCQLCYGRNGGVKGNENVINGLVVCDYCSAKLSKHNLR